MANRHIGGSILPSSDRSILTPLGSLQVRAMSAQDTHGLFYGESLIAQHPNGYSCHALAVRMVVGNVKHALAQADYIAACGGRIERDRIIGIMDAIRTSESIH